MHGFTLATLPRKLQTALLSDYVLANPEEYRHGKSTGAADSLFAAFSAAPAAQVTTAPIIWGTDSYEAKGFAFSTPITVKGFPLIVPRAEKAKEEQKRRTKDKAEVFTPSWVCNLQNNLVDDEVVGKGAFNSAEAGSKEWVPTSEPVPFKDDAAWVSYVTSPRLEITCGEGPYLMSRYDTTTGEFLPVRDAEGRFQRIGLLDRKLRVVSERAPRELWVKFALAALEAIYGYEWQGDNLLLARLNFLNTFVDYYRDTFGEEPDEKLLLEVTRIAAWQLWQMDGLKFVKPLSCAATCESCATKKRTGHRGSVALLHMGGKTITFEELLPESIGARA